MKKLEREILKKIKSGEVRMRPWWWFAGLRVAWDGLMGISLILAAIGGGSLVYFLDTYRPSEWTEYVAIGAGGLIMEDFPIKGSVLLIVCGLLGVGLSLGVGSNYRKGWRQMAVWCGLAILGLMILVEGLKRLL